jgi:hypothetical protein
MNCSQARDEMLVAELAALRGSGALGVHLESCASCRRLANAILGDSERLAGVIGSRRPRRVTGKRIALAAAVPIAAGIIVAFAVTAKRPDVVPIARTSTLPVAKHVSLTVAPGQTAAVLKTADPTVTVIWLSPGGGQ